MAALNRGDLPRPEMLVDVWPLVGRRCELDRVATLLRSGERAGVVLAGPGGVGRTRLAGECLAIAGGMSYGTCRITATESAAALPLGAFGPLLPPLPRNASSPKVLSAVLNQVQRNIAHRASEGRLALLIDDAHLLDDESAILVHQLACTRTAFVIATIRSEVAAPEPLLSLWKDETVARIDVKALSSAAVETLLSAVLGGPVDGATRHYFVARTRGNVQLLRELVLSALDTGTLRDDGGMWRLVGNPAPSARLVELVERTLRSLSADERSVLEIVACDEPLAMAVLGQLADAPHLESLERRGLVTVCRQGRRREIRLAHPLHGDVIREQIPVLRSEALRRALASAVEGFGMHRREDVLRIVRWRLDGGRHIPTELALSAAARAEEVGDVDLAARLAAGAVDTGGGFEAALLVGRLAGLRGRAELAEATLAALTPAATTDAQRVLLAVSRANNLLMRMGDPAEALRVLGDADAAGADQQWRDELSSKRAYVLLCSGSRSAAVAIGDGLASRADGRALSEACVVNALAYSQAGRLDAALDMSRTGEAALKAQSGIVAVWPGWIHQWTRCETLIWRGNLDTADSEARRSYDRAVSEGCRTAQAAFACALNRIAIARGRMATAAVWGREAVTLLRRGSGEFPLRWALADLAWALALDGALDEADAIVAEHQALHRQPDAPFRAHIDHARAWLSVARGDASSAQTFLRDAAAAAARESAFAVEARLLYEMARLGAARDVVDRLEEVACVVQGAYVPAMARHVAAVVHSDGRAVEAASARFEAMGATLLAAEAAADAGRFWRQAGESRRATQAEGHAAQLTGRCEGALTPPLAGVANRTALTAREREVADLAARGLSNREITQRLYLSVRTVENQLQRAYTKLGVRSRTELAAVLRST